MPTSTSRPKRLVIVASLLVLVVAYLAFYRTRRIDVAQTTPVVTTALVPPPDASATRATPDAAVPATFLPAPASPSNEPLSVAGWTARPLGHDPEVERQSARKRDGANIDALYAGFYELAKLTPEQRDRFRNLRLDRGEEIDRLFKAANKQNAGRDRELAATTLDVIKDDVSAAFEQRILQEFGTENLELLKRYDSERSLRSMSGQVAAAVATSATPLSPAQSERLVSTLAVSAMTPQGTIDFSKVDVERTMRAAETFLSASQAAALQPVLESKVRAAHERRRPPNPHN